jgi:hypothetical protein
MRICSAKYVVVTHSLHYDNSFDLVGGLGTCINVGLAPEFERFASFRPIVLVWLAASLIGNIVVAVIFSENYASAHIHS